MISVDTIFCELVDTFKTGPFQRKPEWSRIVTDGDTVFEIFVDIRTEEAQPFVAKKYWGLWLGYFTNKVVHASKEGPASECFSMSIIHLFQGKQQWGCQCTTTSTVRDLFIGWDFLSQLISLTSSKKLVSVSRFFLSLLESNMCYTIFVGLWIVRCTLNDRRRTWARLACAILYVMLFGGVDIAWLADRNWITSKAGRMTTVEENSEVGIFRNLFQIRTNNAIPD